MKHLGFHWTDFHEIWYKEFFENMPRKFTFHSNLTRITGSLHGHLCTFMIIPRWILLRMSYVSDKSCRENQNTQFMFNNFFFRRKSCHLWDNVEEYGTAGQATDDNIIRRMRTACWITKATDTYTEYVILTAFPRQHLWRERASTLICTYIARLVKAHAGSVFRTNCFPFVSSRLTQLLPFR
jgi:hypothetical protein